MGTARDLNSISINGREFLLTATAGEAIHLSREAQPGKAGRAALPEWRLKVRRKKPSPLLQGYNRAALAEVRWAETTMCGRQWIAMVGVEHIEAQEFSEDEASSPSCRRCLALMDALFPEPQLDDRFGLVVQVITDTVVEHGYAEMRNVPGDHHAALRKRVRSAVKEQTGYGIQTIIHESMVIFVCEPIHQQHAKERGHAAAQAVHDVLTGKPSQPLPTPWRLSWDTWAVE